MSDLTNILQVFDNHSILKLQTLHFFHQFQQVLADRWFQKDPTVVSFDNKLQYYFKTIDEVEAIPVVKDQECIRLHMGPLATSVKG